ncbi:MAG: polyprenol monophosphomannose synthase [Candidatus Nanopelagicales bacterium]
MNAVQSVLIVIPTYNEAETLPSAIAQLREHVPQAHVLVVDDGSPDGTGQIADGLAAEQESVHVLHRTSKRGLGAAYLAGFRWALARSSNVVVEMDADGSHQPQYLPAMLSALQQADVVIGSRWVPGGAVQNWPKSRLLLSKGGNTYTRVMLGLKVRDATAGYRAYRRSALESIDLNSVQSQGYCFQVDLTRRAARNNLRIVEVPITFVEREWGESKMSNAIVAEALWRVTVWGLRDRVSQLTKRGKS